MIEFLKGIGCLILEIIGMIICIPIMLFLGAVYLAFVIGTGIAFLLFGLSDLLSSAATSLICYIKKGSANEK